jgi:NADPH:quinone reductase-like Zn-dependent oxidoreductase
MSLQTDAVAWPAADAVPATMRATTMREFGPPDVLQSEELPTPEPAADEVLVRVAAVSVGRLLDLLARSGRHPFAGFTFPHVLGAECAGTVVARGEDAGGVPLGAHVAVFPVITAEDDEWARAGLPEQSPTLQILGTHRPGAYAQYVAVPARNVRVAPEGMTPLEAVGVILAGAVAMNQFARVGGVGPGSRVVVQGAASALGSTTALLAKHLGAEVVALSRSRAKRDVLAGFGFTAVIDPSTDDFPEQIVAAFGGRPAQVIVDDIGHPDLWRRQFRALGPGGVIVSSGAFLADDLPIDLRRMYVLGQSIVGVRTGNLAAVDRLWEHVHAGFRTVLDRTWPVEEAALAHAYVEGDGNVGRVALTVG